mgnify:CR=1 FL=1
MIKKKQDMHAKKEKSEEETLPAVRWYQGFIHNDTLSQTNENVRMNCSFWYWYQIRNNSVLGFNVCLTYVFRGV